MVRPFDGCRFRHLSRIVGRILDLTVIFIPGEGRDLVRTPAEVEGEIEDVLPQGGAAPDASAARNLTEHPVRSDDLCQAIAHYDASIGLPPYSGGLFSDSGLQSSGVSVQPVWAARLFDAAVASETPFAADATLLLQFENAYYRAARPTTTASSSPWLKGEKGSTRSILRTTLPHGHESTQGPGTDTRIVDRDERVAGHGRASVLSAVESRSWTRTRSPRLSRRNAPRSTPRQSAVQVCCRGPTSGCC